MSLIGCDGEGEGLGRLLRNATDFSHLSEQQQVHRQRAGAALSWAATSEAGSLQCTWVVDEQSGQQMPATAPCTCSGAQWSRQQLLATVWQRRMLCAVPRCGLQWVAECR